jgi:drug/metabolite transporter (DMT)-like permease
MTFIALVLVFTSAFFHAAWNYLAKRVSGGIAFVWILSTLGTVLYLPVLIIALLRDHPQFGMREITFLLGTAILHVSYYLLLNYGYKVGDLSLVYPLARGTGPILATIGAILFIGESPSLLRMLGIVLIAVAVFALTGDPRKFRAEGTQQAIAFGVLTGISIAAYTLWDAESVKKTAITPLILTWFSGFARTVFLAPFIWQRRQEVRAIWSEFRRDVVLVSILDPLSYILFLTAFALGGQVSYLAPARQMSILIGALMGTRLLAERNSARRMAAVGAMMVGLMILAIG